MATTRIDTESLGSIDIAATRHWGPQNERVRRPFRIGTMRQYLTRREAAGLSGGG